jgi:hypothetical protein
MRFRFIGKYTNGHTGIDACGVWFDGREPSEVPPEAVARLSRNIEFEQVHPLDHDGDGRKGGSLPKRRGRPRKVAP